MPVPPLDRGRVVNPKTLFRLGRALFLGQQPNYVIAFVTGRCNLDCSFCCHAAQHAQENSATRELTAEQWAAMFSGLPALIHLTITGGEPFLRGDLTDIIIKTVRGCGVPRISINTNGYLTERIVSSMNRLARELDGTEIALAVSLDGPETVHDSLRALSGAFRAAKDTVMEATILRNKFKRFTVRVCSVLCQKNAASLESFMEETAAWPIDYHDIGLVRDVPLAEQRDLAESYARLTARQQRNASTRYFRGIDWRLQRRVRDEVLTQVFTENHTRMRCLAGSRLLEVFPDGTVRGCEMAKLWQESLLAEGSETPARLADVVRLPAARRFQKRAAACGCSFECAHACNIAFRPGGWWRLLL